MRPSFTVSSAICCLEERPPSLLFTLRSDFARPLYSILGVFNQGVKYSVFLNFWYSVYKRNVGVFSLLKCLILSACVTFKKKKIMIDLQFLRHYIRLRS